MKFFSFSKRALADKDMGELNLAPFIDVFVTLVVFLLLSTVFVRLGSVAVKTPGESSSVSEDSKAKQERSLFVLIQSQKFMVESFSPNRGLKEKPDRREFKYSDFALFEKYIQSLKDQKEHFSQVILRVEAATAYGKSMQVMQVLDEASLSESLVLATGSEDEE